MKRSLRFALVILAFTALAVNAAQAETIQATLTGYQEVPSVSTVASGEFRGFISRNDDSIAYELSYSGLQGDVRQAHIHVAQPSVNGSIVIWLCGTVSNPGPGGTQICPQAGTITGTISAANVIAGSTASQQLSAGDLDEIVRAIRAGSAYVNVHTDLSTGGEIRGQINAAAKK